MVQLVYGPHQFAMQPTNKTVSEADATVVVMEEDFTPTKLQDLAGTWIKVGPVRIANDAVSDFCSYNKECQANCCTLR